VIEHEEPSHCPISNNALLVIRKETKSTVSDDFKVSLRSDNPLLKFPFEQLGACFRHQDAPSICAPRLTIIV
jgi:hypothetical protein